MKIKVHSNFVDHAKLYGQGEHDVADSLGDRFISEGKATEIVSESKKPTSKVSKETSKEVELKIINTVPVGTPLPEDFPERGNLIANGIISVEQLKGPAAKEALGKIKKLDNAAITKIGLAAAQL